MASQFHHAYLLVQSVMGGIVIRSRTPEHDDITGDNKVALHPAESFGGHTFGEWQAVAKGTDRVMADWLEF